MHHEPFDCNAARPSEATDRRTVRQRRGDAGEAMAARYLQSHGLVILERGFRRRIGELDLICVEPRDGGIVFVEVRYRSGFSHGGPLVSVDAAKRRRLLRTARAWLQSRRVDPRRAARIDVIGIAPTVPTIHVAARSQAPDDATEQTVGTWQNFENQALCWCRAVT